MTPDDPIRPVRADAAIRIKRSKAYPFPTSTGVSEMKLSNAQWWVIRVGALILVLAVGGAFVYPRLINWVIPYAHRPERIIYPVQKVSDAEFEAIARDLQGRYLTRASVDTAAANAPVYQAIVRQLQERVPSF